MFIHINSQTAKKKGIQDGIGWRWSPVRKIQGKAKLTELIHPKLSASRLLREGTIHMNPVAKEGPPFNALMTAKDNVVWIRSAERSMWGPG